MGDVSPRPAGYSGTLLTVFGLVEVHVPDKPLSLVIMAAGKSRRFGTV